MVARQGLAHAFPTDSDTNRAMPSQAGLAAPDQGEVALYLLQLVGRRQLWWEFGKRVAGWDLPSTLSSVSFAAATRLRRHC